MDSLFKFSQREDFQQFVSQVVRYKHVQGVTIGVNPIAVSLARLQQMLPKSSFSSVLEYLDDLSNFWGPLRPGLTFFICEYLNSAINGLDRGSAHLGPPLNFESVLPARFRNSYWDNFGPFIIRVSLLPWQEGEELVDFSDDYSFAILFERRLPAKLSGLKDPNSPLIGGISVGEGSISSCTLGGIIEVNSKKYGVTCAHAFNNSASVDQPAQSDNTNNGSIGRVHGRCSLTSSPGLVTCNPYNPSSVMNEVDVAVIDIGNNPADLKIANLGNLSGVYSKSKLYPTQRAYYVGKELSSSVTSKTLFVGGLNVTYRITGNNGNSYCFKNTFEVLLPKANWGQGLEAVDPGDSGAWVCVDDVNGHSWAGSVIASNNEIGFAVFSETTCDWIKKHFSAHSINM